MKETYYLTIIFIITCILSIFFLAKLLFVCFFITLIIFLISAFKLLSIYVEPEVFELYAIKIGLKSKDNYYIVGSSRALHFFKPNRIEKHIQGKTIRNISAHGQPPYHSYIIMRKLLKKKTTEVIFYDITMLTFTPCDFDKIEYLENATKYLQNRLLGNLNYMEKILYCIHYKYPLNLKTLISLFTIYRYRVNLKLSLKQFRKMFLSSYNNQGERISREHMPSKGYKIPNFPPAQENIDIMHKTELRNININDIDQETLPTEYGRMLISLLELAKRKNKKIHFIISPLYPIPAKMPLFYRCHDHLLRIIDDYDSQLIDFNKNVEDSDYDISYFHDYYHTNDKGADLASDQLADIIKNMNTSD